MTGAEFMLAEWPRAFADGGCWLLGLSRRTIMGYVRKDQLPAVVAIACRALSRDKNRWRHFVPARKLPGGCLTGFEECISSVQPKTPP